MKLKFLVLSSLLGLACCPLHAAPPGYVKVWEDTFEGTALNTANWTIGLRDPASGDLVPGAAGGRLLNTGYAGYNTDEDVQVSGGTLILQNQKRSYTGTDPAGNYSYTTGWIMSMHKVHFNKGYVEMRARYPSGDKVWPALWLIAEDLIWGPEWDLFEYFGYRGDIGYDLMGMHLAYGTYPSIHWLGNWIENYHATLDAEAWHIYGFEWTANYARWYIDGVEVAHMDNTIGNKWPDEQMYIVLNNGVRTDSPDSNTSWPNYLIVDYIELYQADSECGNGSCEVGEDCLSCPGDCIGLTRGKPSGRYCCGDGACEHVEDEAVCSVDCGSRLICGDSLCSAGETVCSCAADCGPPSTSETSCLDGVDEDCDGATDCGDADCSSDPACADGGVLLSDDFESGEFSTHGWIVNKAQVHTQGAYTGIYGVKFQRLSSIENYVSTAGRTGIVVEYDRTTVNYDPEDFFIVEWFDGVSWQPVEATQDDAWSHFSLALPAAAGDNPAFGIRFTGSANRPTDKAFLDNVAIRY